MTLTGNSNGNGTPRQEYPAAAAAKPPAAGLQRPAKRAAASAADRAHRRQLAEAIANCAVSMLGRHCVVVSEATDDPSGAPIITAVDAPFPIEARRLPAGQGMPWHDAQNVPQRCHSRDVHDIELLLAGGEPLWNGAGTVATSKLVPLPGDEAVVLTVVTPREFQPQSHEFLYKLSDFLKTLSAAEVFNHQTAPSQFAIHNAKNEWEATVDAIDDLICLVDASGKIIRANRTAERWRLSSVTSVRGQSIHETLHPGCPGSHCPLRAAVDLRLLDIRSVDSSESVIVDQHLERALRVQIRRVDHAATEDSSLRHAEAVVIVSDVTALHNARNELRALNDSLEQQVRDRTMALARTVRRLKLEIEQRTAAELELKHSRDELALLSRQLIGAQEDERSRLSRELHDSLGQSLGAVKYTLERLATNGSLANVQQPENVLNMAIAGVAEAIRDTRTIAMRLRPPILDEMGAAAAVKWLIRYFSSIYPEIEFRLDDRSVAHIEIGDQTSIHIYRIVQEAVNNAVKHGHPRSVVVSLRRGDDGLVLEIRDDGVGFETNAGDTGQFRKLGHFGHLGMRERAANSNGVLTIDSAPGKGTTVRVEWSAGPGASTEECMQ